ncbi:MAG: ATP-dependent helicase [Nitrospiraceae bacterium]|nr:MAG: ATP-dependent helicase [Nitrospiraceae bacterium]
MTKYHLKASVPARVATDYSSHLNPEQLEAVTSGDGPSLVIAGAGSGKTRVVTYRVAYLMESGVSPSRIMLLTFTNRAAREMLHRVELLMKGEARKVWGGTFHHIGNMILRQYGDAVNLNTNFTILDSEDTKDLIDSCIAELNLRTQSMFPKGKIILEVISRCTGTERPILDVIENDFSYLLLFAEEIEKVNQLYVKKKKGMNLVDFDDLLYYWKKILLEAPSVKDKLTEKFLHILVDEYQDTNKIQAEIVDIMASKHRNPMVVGDDAQSIYSFRGACFDNIIRFPERYPDARIFKLTTNYRSTDQILALANGSIAHNRRQFPKVLHSVQRRGPAPALVPLENRSQEAEFVSQRILDLIDEGMPLREIAVLYRSHYQSMELQMELTRRRIPYEVRSGLRFFEQAHIKDVISYLRAALNPLDEISWTRILKLIPGIGNVTAKKIWEYIKASESPLETAVSDGVARLLTRRAKANWNRYKESMESLKGEPVLNHPSEAIREILEKGYIAYLQSNYENYEDRLEDIEQLSNYSEHFKSTKDFLSDLALLNSVQAEDVAEPGEESESIVLSTIHRAKGLEWSRVFIIGLTEGNFPTAKSMGSLEGEEEERRVFYVAVTRAKDELYLCYPVMDDRWYEGSIIKRPSPYIQELPEHTYEKWEIEG